MPSVETSSFAVIADAHFHDVDSDYHCRGTTVQGRRLILRSWADTRRSSRVFNESKAALETALTGIGQRGIKHVVLLGDYTDDGQIEATRRLVKLLRHYQKQYDIAFYAIPGNHDVHGPVGKHQSTRFSTAPGETVLVTSSDNIAATENNTSVLTRNMYCEGTPAGLLPMAEFGLFRQVQYLYWETPFGQCDSTESRQYKAYSADGQTMRQLMDASYLVEPVDGLWFLMIDANVFEPRNGQWELTQKRAFFNSSDAGWNAVIRVKPFLIDWIEDVCSRAKALGKNLYAFSHYPVVDPFNDAYGVEKKLFGNTSMVKRTPNAEIARTLCAAGMQLHFSGHLHVNSTIQKEIDNRQLTDIAVPSLVAFPSCYKVVHSTRTRCTIDTVALSDMPLDPLLMQHYKDENNANGSDNDPALLASNYGEFLYKRMHSRVRNHYLPKEWPTEIAREIEKSNAADLVRFMMAQPIAVEPISYRPLPATVPLATDTEIMTKLIAEAARYKLQLHVLALCSMTQLIADWYCLRQAGDQALIFIDADKISLYRFLSNTFGDQTPAGTNRAFTFFSIFLAELACSLQRAMHNQSEI